MGQVGAGMIAVAILLLAILATLVVCVVVAARWRVSSRVRPWLPPAPEQHNCRHVWTAVHAGLRSARARIDLDAIRNSTDSHAGLLAYVRVLWTYPGTWTTTTRGGGPTRYVLSTAGMPETNALIDAMQDNAAFWSACFVEHEPGGRYVFEVKS